MSARPRISLSELPDNSQPQMDFLDTTWFKTHGRTQPFPTPEQVLFVSKSCYSATLVRFKALGLVVKFGPHVFTTEAINLWVIRRVFQDDIPVPEVYGWRVLEQKGKPRQVFIYMQLVQGPTLEKQWSELSLSDKQAICSNLRAMVSRLRTLQDGEPQQIIGTICHSLSEDYCLEGLPTLKLFTSRAELHDWLSFLWRRNAPDPLGIPDRWRDLLPDNGSIVFTHGDLRPANIIITATSPPKVAAIVDWQMSGWYPDYWEYCKATFTAEYHGEWWYCIEQIMEPHPQELEAFDYYTCTLGVF